MRLWRLLKRVFGACRKPETGDLRQAAQVNASATALIKRVSEQQSHHARQIQQAIEHREQPYPSTELTLQELVDYMRMPNAKGR